MLSVLEFPRPGLNIICEYSIDMGLQQQSLVILTCCRMNFNHLVAENLEEDCHGVVLCYMQDLLSYSCPYNDDASDTELGVS
jgi:hypothetical protein